MSYEYTNCNQELTIKFRLLLVIFSVSFQLSAQVTAVITHRYFNNFEDSILNTEWMNPTTITSSDDSTKNHFSRTNELNHYSSGIDIAIPENLRRKNFRISVIGVIRVSNTTCRSQVVISVSQSDSAIFWKGQFVPDESGKLNEWNKFNINALIPLNIPVKSKVKIFLWNPSGNCVADVDELEIYFTEMKFPSFIPE